MLATVNMFRDVFDVMMPCDEVVANVLESTAACILHCENGGSRLLWEVGSHLPGYKLLYPRI